jgi:SnoaL-like domain
MNMRVDDREAIRQIIAAYAHAIDRRRWDMIGNLFHDDGVFKFAGVDGDWRGFIEQAGAILNPCIATQHQLGQTLIGFESADVAHTETYMTAMHIVPAGYPRTEVFPDWGRTYSAVVAGRYIDRFERRSGSWKIASRTGLYDWREYRELGEGADLAPLPQDVRGYHDDRDPSTPVVARFRGKGGGA